MKNEEERMVSVGLAANSLLIEWNLNQTNPVVRRPKYLCAILCY